MSGVWDRALPVLARATRDPLAQRAADYVVEWLGVVAAQPERAPEFDRAIEEYAAELRGAGFFVADQGAGFLLALTAFFHRSGETNARLVVQVDRRLQLTGRRHCPWRGTTPLGAWDAWRWDRARERAGLPRKGES